MSVTGRDDVLLARMACSGHDCPSVVKIDETSGDLALLDALLEVRLDLRKTARDDGGVDVEEEGFAARLGGDVRDAVAHRAGADDEDAFDVHASLPGTNGREG